MNEFLIFLDWKYPHLDANAASRRQRSATFATRSNLHLIAIFRIQWNRKSRKTCIHTSRQVWYLIVLCDSPGAESAAQNEMNDLFTNFMYIFFFQTQYCLLGLFLFIKENPGIQLLCYTHKTNFHGTIFCTSSFWEGKGRVTTWREGKGGGKIATGSRIMIDTYAHDDMRYDKSLGGWNMMDMIHDSWWWKLARQIG